MSRTPALNSSSMSFWDTKKGRTSKITVTSIIVVGVACALLSILGESMHDDRNHYFTALFENIKEHSFIYRIAGGLGGGLYLLGSGFYIFLPKHEKTQTVVRRKAQAHLEAIPRSNTTLPRYTPICPSFIGQRVVEPALAAPLVDPKVPLTREELHRKWQEASRRSREVHRLSGGKIC